jgi:hypothetical protein
LQPPSNFQSKCTNVTCNKTINWLWIMNTGTSTHMTSSADKIHTLNIMYNQFTSPATKCTKFFLKYLCYITTQNAPTCFKPQRDHHQGTQIKQ